MSSTDTRAVPDPPSVGRPGKQGCQDLLSASFHIPSTSCGAKSNIHYRSLSPINGVSKVGITLVKAVLFYLVNKVVSHQSHSHKDLQP